MDLDKTQLEAKVEDVAVKAGGILRSRYGLWALGAISFVESALVVPIVTDPFLVAYILADKKSTLRGVAVTLVASVIGGVFAYAIALLFFEFLAAKYLVGPIGEQFYSIADEFNEGTLVITLLGAVTPIPYTIVAMAAGFVRADLIVFIIGSIIGRAFRYGLVGWLTYKYGERALAIARRQLFFISIACIVAAAVYFYLHF